MKTIKQMLSYIPSNNNISLLKLILPLFFICFALGEISKIRFSGAISVGLFDITVVLLSIYYLKKIRRNQFRLKIPIIIFILASVFSLIINVLSFEPSQLFVGSLYLVRFVAYTGIYFVAASLTPLGKKYTLKFMTISGVFILLLGYIQYFLYPSLKNLFYLGWDEHMYRMVSSYLDPNFAGVIFVLLFIFFYVFQRQLFPKKYISILVLSATFISIILTYSRGALLMFVVSALIYSILKKNYKIIFAAIGSLLIVFIILSPRFYIENTNLLRTFTLGQRVESIRQGLYIAKENPLGVGYNTFRYARENYGFADTSAFGPSHAGAGVDNSLVLILATAGIPGFLAYLYLIFRMFGLGINNLKRNDMAIVLIVSLGGLLVNSMLINSLLYSFIMAWIFLIAGLTENNEH